MRVHVAFVILDSSFDGLPALSGAIGALVRPRMGPKSSPLDHGAAAARPGSATCTIAGAGCGGPQRPPASCRRPGRRGAMWLGFLVNLNFDSNDAPGTPKTCACVQDV